jgi:hypothetical protein
MKAEDLLMVVVIAGVGLTLIYIVAECRSWRTVKAAEHKAMSELRELYKKLHAATKPFTKSFTRPFGTKTIARK